MQAPPALLRVSQAAEPGIAALAPLGPFAQARVSPALQHGRGQLLARAKEEWPERWRSFAPLPFRFATWVGYDMDGRTDIAWSTSVGFMKAMVRTRFWEM